MLTLRFGLQLSVSLLISVNLCCMGKSKEVGMDGPPFQNRTIASTPASLKELWEAQSRNLARNSKNYPLERLNLMLALMDKAPDEQVKRELEKVRAMSTAGPELPEYERTLLEAFVARGIRQGDREMLIDLLSTKSPRYIASSPLELYLATSDLKNPLLVLFESYKKSTNEDAKHTLIQALSHVSSSLPGNFRDDKEYVSAVEEWYLKNKDVIMIDPYYHPNSPFPEQRQLFIMRH